METLFLSIQKHIADNLPELSVVDEDYGQLMPEEDIYPVTFPCVLIAIRNIAWEEVGEGVQKGKTDVDITLAIDCYHDTHYASREAGKVQERMRLFSKLHALIERFHGNIIIREDGLPVDTNYTPLVRRHSTFVSLPGGIKAYQSTYQTTIIDDSGKNAK